MPLLKNNTLIPETWTHADAEGDLPGRRRGGALRPPAEGVGTAVASARASSASRSAMSTAPKRWRPSCRSCS